MGNIILGHHNNLMVIEDYECLVGGLPKALVVTKVEVNMKKISNRKTMSVMDDILKAALNLCLDLNAILVIFSDNF